MPFGDLGGRQLDQQSLAGGARTMERLGFDSIWTFDTIGRETMVPDRQHSEQRLATIREA